MALKQKDERLYTDTGVYLGDVLASEDGFYYFWPDHKGGCWSEGNLLELCAHLRRINAEWDVQMQTDPIFDK